MKPVHVNQHVSHNNHIPNNQAHKMKILFSYFFSLSIIIAFVFLAGCAKEKAAEPSKITDTVACIQPGQTITYTDDMKLILQTYCTDKGFGSCHQSDADGGTFGFDFTTYAGIKEKVDDGTLVDRVFNSPGNPMPSVLSTGPQTLSDCDLLKLQTWIDQGAIE